MQLSVRVTRRTIGGFDMAVRARRDPIRGTMDRTILIANSIRPYLRRADATLRYRRGASRLRTFIIHRDTLTNQRLAYSLRRPSVDPLLFLHARGDADE